VSTFVDPRVRMREALYALVAQEPTTWDRPSLTVLRNRLLDHTGSDARPLAELLLEAIRRGFRERIAEGALETARWDALIAPFVMQWSAERFIQPDMARWAVECWGYALGVIQPEQLRIAPPPRPEPLAVLAARLQGTAAAAGAQVAHRAGLNPTASVRRFTAAPKPPATAPRGPTRAPSASAPRTTPPFRSTRGVPVTPVNPWIARGLVGTIALMGMGVITQVVLTTRRPDTAAPRAMAVAPVTAPVTPQPPQTASTLVPQNLTGGVTIIAPPNPGVTAITRTMLPTGADSGRMVFVEPARRAVGESRRVNLPTTMSAATYDEVHLEDGSTMRGRVEIVRAGAVIFRDLRTGLRHELRKEDIDEIITEFGTPVRFRAASTGGRSPRSRAMVAEATKNGVRARGVSGVYRVRYTAPVSVGSSECASVWTRAPDATDRAVVRHAAGADTLTLAFDRGDNFPSNVDPDGFFASTFRIVPDQARTSTALTTRLTGQFRTNGTVALTVNIVFFRRMRSGADLACTVTVKAEGRRES
jgi:hypothetical protein